MASVSKIIEEMLRDPVEMRTLPIIKVIESFGFQRKKNTTGSHFIFIKGDEMIEIVSHHNKVKRWYIRKIVDILKLEEYHASQNECN
jgi:predicted RNA binding protein YcfA (HicA-like mRNA interferase family)